MINKISTIFLNTLSPEVAHNIAIFALKYFYHNNDMLPDGVLDGMSQNFLGYDFAHPLGLAAGFDKNAMVFDKIGSMGFSFMEAGAVTLNPQPGNKKPRLFRLAENKAIINRYGFNSKGLNYIISNFRNKNKRCITGVNIGLNKGSNDYVTDFIKCIVGLNNYVDFLTLNLSSPNTPGLRDLLNEKSLAPLLKEINILKDKKFGFFPKIFVKLSPDMNDKDIYDLVNFLSDSCVDGLIVCNTTVKRNFNISDKAKLLEGGLSGTPLKNISLKMLEKIYPLVKGKLKIISSGGVSDGADIYHRICMGADLVQILTSFVYEGPTIINRLLSELAAEMKKNGVKDLSEIKGSYYE